MLTKLRFWLMWTLAHALGGAFGMLMGEIVVRSKLFGSYSLIAGFVLFEGILALVKHGVFRFFKEMNYVQGIDHFAWIGAGVAILVGRLSGEGTQGEEITVVSLDLLRLYGFLVNGFLFTSQIPRFFNPEAYRRRKLWFSQAKENLQERPLLKPISLLVLILAVILLYGLGLVLIAASFLIVLGPIEELKIVLHDMPPGLMRVIVFGCTSVGWIGFLSGLCYILSFPKGLTVFVDMFKVKRA